MIHATTGDLMLLEEIEHLRAEKAALADRVEELTRQFKDAWEEFQSDFMRAADFDKEHGGAWIIEDASYETARRKVNAVIGAALKEGE